MKRSPPAAPEGEEHSYSVFREYWGGSLFDPCGKKRSVLEMYKGEGDATSSSDSTTSTVKTPVTLDSKREALLESLRKVVSEASELVYVRTSSRTEMLAIEDKQLDDVETSLSLFDDQKSLVLFGKGDISDEQKLEWDELTEQRRAMKVTVPFLRWGMEYIKECSALNLTNDEFTFTPQAVRAL